MEAVKVGGGGFLLHFIKGCVMILFMSSDSGRKRFTMRDVLPEWNFCEYVVLRGIATGVNCLPISWSSWTAKKIGDLLFFCLGKRRKIAFDNIKIAFGDSLTQERKTVIVKATFRNLVTALMELFRTPGMLKDADRSFELEGTEHLDRALARGKGLILAISHLGSWEYLGFMPYLRPYVCSVIGRPMKNPYVYKWVQSLRRKTTLNHIDKNNAIKEVLKELRANHVVGILIDQWAGSEGIWGNFFGEGTSTTSIPARLSKKTGCALVPAYCIRLGSGRYKISIQPEVQIQDPEGDWERKTTDELNRLLEGQILRYPDQWTWTHRRWKGINACRGKVKF